MLVREMIAIKGGDVLRVAADASVTEAVAAMCDSGVGSAVVCDEAGLPAGIVTERDVLRQFARHGAGLGSLKVADIMSSPVHTTAPDATLIEVMKLMTANRFRHVPVIDDGALVGILSIGDVVKARLGETESEAESLRQYISTSY